MSDSSAKIKKLLYQALNHIPDFEACSLLDYPEYLNLGDHLIWLASVLYLTQSRKVEIKYAASENKFSKAAFEARNGKHPILFCGGGNLGDVWPGSQTFREHMISQYPDHPIVILPQSIYFESLDRLKSTAQIFNRHPDLTLFVRDCKSYEIAADHFHKCKIFLAPDMAFQLVDELNSEPYAQPQSKAVLYLCRSDRELQNAFSPANLDIGNLQVRDWASYQWKLGVQQPMMLRYVADFIREGLQRGALTPKEWWARQFWLQSRLREFSLDQVYQAKLHRRSLSFIHSAIYLLSRYERVITNRLHGHIFCILLGIPHVFLPNSYHKNEAFYRAWTSEIGYCQFVDQPSMVKPVIDRLQRDFGKSM